MDIFYKEETIDFVEKYEINKNSSDNEILLINTYRLLIKKIEQHRLKQGLALMQLLNKNYGNDSRELKYINDCIAKHKYNVEYYSIQLTTIEKILKKVSPLFNFTSPRHYDELFIEYEAKINNGQIESLGVQLVKSINSNATNRKEPVIKIPLPEPKIKDVTTGYTFGYFDNNKFHWTAPGNHLGYILYGMSKDNKIDKKIRLTKEFWNIIVNNVIFDKFKIDTVIKRFDEFRKAEAEDCLEKPTKLSVNELKEAREVLIKFFI